MVGIDLFPTSVGEWLSRSDRQVLLAVDSHTGGNPTRIVLSGIDLPEGVYCWYSGPSFETPAEIRMLKLLGGDAVGMSTVPEVILARFLGLRVAAISTITNMAAGMSDEQISHEHTKAMAPLGAAKLERILREFLRSRK